MDKFVRAVLFIIVSGVLAAQPPQAKPATQRFEVISIRPCEPKSGGGGVSGSPGRLTVPCASVRNLIGWSFSGFQNGRHFDLSSVPIEGGPAWVDSDFTINAKANGDPNILTMLAGPMMRALLEDRFKLKIHRATRQALVYALILGKGALKLQPFKEGVCIDKEDPWDHPLPESVLSPMPGQPSPKICRTISRADNGFDVYGTTMTEFCTGDVFRGRVLDRPVVDQTGITGTFNLHLDLSPGDRGIPNEVVANATGQRQSNRPALDDPADRFDAMRVALRKIGLDLRATKGPQEVIVIDHVERPSEN
jgi:uncharacterized protein (TIGR03435 family)